MAFLLLTCFFQQSMKTALVSVPFEFRDRSTINARSALQFRALEFATAPVRPVRTEGSVGDGTLYSLLPVGSSPEDALTVVWYPKAVGGPRLWVDVDRSAKFTMDKARHFDGKELEYPITVIAQPDTEKTRLARTAIFRRSSVGNGLLYAVRGFAEGKLVLGDKSHRTLLVDGDADGCFSTAGADRVWIDLNDDGHFDPLTEQFFLGSPITANGNVYIVRSNATASKVSACARASGSGRVRFSLTTRDDMRARQVAMQLVSDIGELVTVGDLDRTISLLAGRYRMDSIQFSLTAASGATWFYRFAGGREYAVVVAPEKESRAVVLGGLTLQVSVPSSNSQVSAGDMLSVTPHLRTSCGLYLADCHTLSKGAFEPTSGGAEIRLRNGMGDIVDHAASGFM
jgi:hypothetical protein